MAESFGGGGFLDHCEDGNEVANREKASTSDEFPESHATWSADGCTLKASCRSTDSTASALETCSRGVANGAFCGASIVETVGPEHISPATCACVSGCDVALAASSLPSAVAAVDLPNTVCAAGGGASGEAAARGPVVSGGTIVHAASPNKCLSTACAASRSLTDVSTSDITAANAPLIDARILSPSQITSPPAKQTRPLSVGPTFTDKASTLNREYSADLCNKCAKPAAKEPNTPFEADATLPRAPYGNGGSLGAGQMLESRLYRFSEFLCSLTARRKGTREATAHNEAAMEARCEIAKGAATAPAAATDGAPDVSASQQGVASSQLLATGAAPQAKLGFAHVAAESVAAEVEDACSLKEPSVTCTDSGSVLRQSLNEGDEASVGFSGASKTRSLLQQLKERGAHAARISLLSISAADLSMLWKAATSFDGQDAEDLQRQEGSTVSAAAASRQELLQEQGNHLCGAAAAAALAATAARAQRAMEPQIRTVWNILRRIVADSSHASLQAVQRAASSANSATGAGDRASGVLAFPLFNACSTSPAGGQRNNETLPQVEEKYDAREYVGELSERSTKVDKNSSEEMASVEELNDADATSQGLLGGLHRRQQVIAEELKKRSTNLVQHSVALGASSTLSEARYHLAEIVDTGGPEVCGATVFLTKLHGLCAKRLPFCWIVVVLGFRSV